MVLCDRIFKTSIRGKSLVFSRSNEEQVKLPVIDEGVASSERLAKLLEFSRV